MNTDELRLSGLSERIIGCGLAVSNGLGAGFVEKVYENALAHELRKAGLLVRQQHPVRILYDNINVGYYLADLLVEELAIVELKTKPLFG